MQKRGALELSITGIVVLIIAITLLGLAIFFIKNLFGGAIKTFGGQFAELEKTLKEDMLAKGDLVAFRLESPEIKRGRSSGFAVGIRNTATSESGKVCFRISVKCLRPFNPDNECVSGEQSPVVVGGYDEKNNELKPRAANWFKKFLAQTDIKENEAKIIDNAFLIRTAKPDSYEMELIVYKEKDDKDCSNAGEFDIYDSKEFTIEVTA